MKTAKLFIAVLMFAYVNIAYANDSAASDCIAVQVNASDDIFSVLATNPEHCYLRNGKWTGIWEERYADGRVQTGPYVNGKQQGIWEARGGLMVMLQPVRW